MGVKYAILGLLHYTDMHGYQIKKHIEHNFGHMWTVNYGQIYPNLKKMEGEGLLRTREVAQQGRPNKKRYSITDKGRKEFRAWLEKTPERGMLLRDPFLMRFVFFGFGDKERSLAIIEDQIRQYDLQHAKRVKNLARWQKQDVYVRLIAQLGLDLNEAMLNWLKKARQEIMQEQETRELVSAAR